MFGPESTAHNPIGYGNQIHLQSRAFVQAAPSQRTQYPVVTGASVLAVKYKDGVMMMADTLASYGKMARYKDQRRIAKVNNTTILGAGGEMSDFDYIKNLLDELTTEDFEEDDGHEYGPKEVYSYLSRVMYNRRSKVNPLWNELVTAGVEDGKSFLGYVDMYGSHYEEDILATGFGTYLAMPLLRKGWREDMDEAEAKQLLEQSMRVLYYRDCREINRFQVATVTGAGITISEPYQLDTQWEYKRFVDPQYQSS